MYKNNSAKLFIFALKHPNDLHKSPKFVSDQISRSVVSDSLWPHESQHARPPCPSPSPGVHSNSRPLSQWCHPAISSSVIPFSSCPQSLSASESFPMSQLFSWGGQSTGVSALASFLPKKDLIIQCTKTWGVLSNESTLCMRWPKYWSFSFSIISFQRNPRADLLQNGLVGSPCSPRDFQESSPTPQFKLGN